MAVITSESFFLRTEAAESVLMGHSNVAGVMDICVYVLSLLYEGASCLLATSSHIEGPLLVEHSWRND